MTFVVGEMNSLASSYHLLVGQRLPKDLRPPGSFHSPDHQLFVVPDGDATNIRDKRPVVAKNQKVHSLTRPSPRLESRREVARGRVQSGARRHGIHGIYGNGGNVESATYRN